MLVITLDGVIDERERKSEIQEQLESYFEDFDNFNYIVKKITLYKDESLEKILIILLKREIVEKIMESCVLEKIKIEGIYPIFFAELFNKDSKRKEYIEINRENFCIFSFAGNRLTNFQNIDFLQDDLIENSQYLTDFLDMNSDIFSYENINGIDFIKCKNWREYSISYDKKLDFLPTEYRKEIEEERITKYLIIALSIIILIFSSISLLLNVYINKKEKLLNIKEIEIEELEEKIENKKIEISTYQEEMRKLENVATEKKNKKIYLWLRKIIDYGENLVDISSIEYIGEKKIYILGTTKNKINFYRYQKLLLDNRVLKKMNHDFFRLAGDRYEFKIEGML